MYNHTGILLKKAGWNAGMPENLKEADEIQMRKTFVEKDILGQLADLLAREHLINPNERMRFLDYLRKEDL